MNNQIRLMFLILTGFIHVEAYGQDANTWTQWRGPTRDCKVAATPGWPKDLESLKAEWTIKLGPSYSGPIVARDRVFVTETHKQKNEIVRALDRKTGKELWSSSWDGAMSVPFFARANGSWIRSTPAYDGRSLFVGGIRDVLVCLDGSTGEVRWRVDFPEQFGTELPAFGFVCSPLVVGDAVFVQAGASLAKLNKETGKVIWRSLKDKGGMYGSAFSSPFLADLHGKTQVLVQGRQELSGVDPGTGKVLWSQQVPAFRGMNILTPTLYGNGILTSTHKNKTFFYALGHDENTFSVTESWTNKGQGYMSSPVVIGDFAYLHLGNGRLACLDLRTGDTRWRSKSFGKYWSMAVQGNRILALDERGRLYLVNANPDSFELVDSKKLEEDDAWAHIAVAGSEVFIRSLNAITKFSWVAR